jgi:hypothetical protein
MAAMARSDRAEEGGAKVVELAVARRWTASRHGS